MKVNATPIVDAVEAIEQVIAVPQAPGTILGMVAHEGNQMLDEESDEAAVSWLKDMTLQLRRVLGAFAPLQRESPDAS